MRLSFGILENYIENLQFILKTDNNELWVRMKMGKCCGLKTVPGSYCQYPCIGFIPEGCALHREQIVSLSP